MSLRQKVKRSIPITSEEQLKRTRTQINATNRRRANNMEYRVAKYLRGDRTPNSGAMSRYKGDVSIEFSHGKYIIECKMSAAFHAQNGPNISIVLAWLQKLQNEAIAMRASFGILIIHFHNISEDYVFVREDHLHWVLEQTNKGPIVQYPPVDMRTKKNGERRSLYPILHKTLLVLNNATEYVAIPHIAPDGIYYVMTLTQWRDLTEGL